MLESSGETQSTEPGESSHESQSAEPEKVPVGVPVVPPDAVEVHSEKAGNQPALTGSNRTPEVHKPVDLESGVQASNRPTESLPGAYAEAFGGDQPPPSLLPSSVDSGSEDGSVPVANAVDDGANLPQAESFEQHESNASLGSKRLALSAMIMGGLFALVVGIVILVVLLISRGKEESASDADAPTASPVTPSPFSIMEERVKSLLPSHTLETLADPSSAQSLALAWLLLDPNLDSYVGQEWRVRQRFALATVFYSNEGFNWDVSKGWMNYTVHECSWWARPWFAPPSPGMRFITPDNPNPCEIRNTSLPPSDGEDGQYKHLWLIKNNLKGYIPEEIFLLTALRSLSLSLNPLSGTISTRFGLLPELEAITLSRNDIGLTGSLPTELGMLSKMSLFSVMGNRLTGDISVLGKLSQLDTVMLDRNRFTGNLPKKLFTISSMRILYMDINSFSGTLPSELGQLTALEDFCLNHNNLHGPVSCYCRATLFLPKFR